MDTYLACLDDTYQFTGEALVIGERTFEDGRQALVLDRTIFYPQGGGQPADQGIICTQSGEFAVSDVRNIDGVIYHFGTFSGSIPVGAPVRLAVSDSRRLYNARLHTAGHLIDVAVQNLALNMVPGKGYHFPDSPYVEYEGEPAFDSREALVKALEAEATRLIELNLPILVRSVGSEEALRLCGELPAYLDTAKPIRVVSIGNNLGCPCAGTHLSNVSEIGSLSVTKMKTKGGKTRVSYALK